MLLLIHPPVVKPSEPPAGISRLLGALGAHGIECRVWDANLECLLGLLQNPGAPNDRWSARAVRNLHRNLGSLRSWEGYRSFDRYKRAVSDLNHLLEFSAPNGSVHVTLTNYQDSDLSPVRSQDLLAAAERPERNPFFPFFASALVGLLEREQPTVVGFSLNYLSQALTAFAMIGFLRRMHPMITLLLGGGLVTSWMRKPDWRPPFAGLVDAMFDGPGENPLLDLLGRKGAERVHFTHEYAALPTQDYIAPGAILPYGASTGCYWNKCGFCPERAENSPYVPIPADHVAADLQELVARNSPVLTHLLDNAVSPALMESFITRPPGAPWYGFARLTPHLADEDFCVGLQRSGCVMLQLGLESGDQKVLDDEQKGISLEVASKALKALKRSGISTYVYLLFGTPSETQDEARKTLGYTVAHSGYIDFLNLAVFNLPVYSPDVLELRTEALSEGDLSLYSGFIHPRGWNRGLVRQFLDKEFKRHPAVASILRSDPPHFTSNHAPFFCRGRH